jgi:transmembrane sensor
MSKQPNTASEIARLQEASEWVQRLHESKTLTLTDEWLEWCGSDPRNLPAFEQMQRIWDGFSERAAATLPAHRPAGHFKYRNAFIGLAASLVVAAAAASWFALRHPQVQVFDTAVGEQRRIVLSDGSRLDLAPGSRVSTHFNAARRDVSLERGQAFFAVAHGVLRPFVVHVNGLTVTAVGTAFDVRMGPNNTVVTVSEGRVSVVPGSNEVGGGPGAAPEIVRAGVGQRVTLSKLAHRLSVANVDPKIAESWRAGSLQFVGEPLADVVAEINRYSARKIDVAPALQETRFTGTVSPQRVGDWLEALQQIYPVEVNDHDPEIHIQERKGNGERHGNGDRQGNGAH